MCDLSQQQIAELLNEKGIEFDTRRGMSNFWYTAFVFKTKRLAWKAIDLLDWGIGPSKGEERGTWEIKHFGS